MDEDTFVIQLNLDRKGVHLAYKVATDALARWSGGNPLEQELLIETKQQLYRCVLEASYTEK